MSFSRSCPFQPRLNFFFFNDTATTEIYALSLHDALPICRARAEIHGRAIEIHSPGAVDRSALPKNSVAEIDGGDFGRAHVCTPLTYAFRLPCYICQAAVTQHRSRIVERCADGGCGCPPSF